MMLKKLMALCFLQLFCCFALEAQNKLDGYVMDLDRVAISNATIELMKDNLVIDVTQSDSLGYFLFNDVAKADYTCFVHHINYNPRFRVVKMEKRDVTHIHKIVLIERSYQIKEINVSQSRNSKSKDYGRFCYHIPKEIRNISTNLFEMLRYVPNVQSNIYERTLAIDGSNNVYLEIDGIARDGNYLSSLSASDVVRVEVMENPTGRYQNKNVDAVINIVTKGGSRGYSCYLGGKLSDHYSNRSFYGGAQYRWSALTVRANIRNNVYDEAEHKDQRVISRHIGNHIFKVDKESDEYAYDDQRQSYSLGVDYRFSDRSILVFDLKGDKNDFSTNRQLCGLYSYDGNIENKSRIEAKNDSEFKNKSYSLSYNRKRENGYLNLSADYNNYSSSYLNDYKETFPSFLYYYWHTFDNDKRLGNLYFDYGSKLSDIGLWEFGGSFRSERIDLFRRYDKNDEIKSSNIDTDLFTAYWTLSKFHFIGCQHEMGLEVDYSNVRVENNPRKGSWFLLPHLTSVFDFNPYHRLTFHYRLFRKMPQITMLNPYLRLYDGEKAIFGNPFLDPYYLNSLDLQYRFKKNNFYFKLEGGVKQSNHFLALEKETIIKNRTIHFKYNDVGKYLNYYSEFQFGLNIAKWWRSNGTISIGKTEYNDKRIDRSLVSVGFDYENIFSFNKVGVHLNIHKYPDCLVSTMVSKNPIKSSCFVQWKMNSMVSFNGGIRYLFPWKKSYVIENDDYDEHYNIRIQDRYHLLYLGMDISLGKGNTRVSRKIRTYGNYEDAQIKDKH